MVYILFFSKNLNLRYILRLVTLYMYTCLMLDFETLSKVAITFVTSDEKYVLHVKMPITLLCSM